MGGLGLADYAAALGQAVAPVAFQPGFLHDAPVPQVYPGLPIGASPESIEKAKAVLTEEIGQAEVDKLEAGGAFAVPSKLFPNTVYLVPATGRIRAVTGGKVVEEYCVYAGDHSVPWPDAVLAKIKHLRSDESRLLHRGNPQSRAPARDPGEVIRMQAPPAVAPPPAALERADDLLDDLGFPRRPR